ncbi:MAG: beta-propeller domain-containing protein [Patescibacteria group bacterium]
MKYLRIFSLVFATIALAFFASVFQAWAATRATAPVVRPSALLKPVGSCYALAGRMRTVAKTQGTYGGPLLRDKAMPIAVMAPNAAMGAAESAGDASQGTQDYSRTNVQVQGVDEADIVKLDGSYSYHLTRNRLAIARVYPAASAGLASVTEIPLDIQAQDFYVDGDRLVLLSTKWENQVYRPMPLRASRIMPWYGRTMTVADVFDIKDRAHPKKVRTVEFDGSLSTSRRIGTQVYLVMNAVSPWDGQTYWRGSADLIPAFKDSRQGTSFQPMAKCATVPALYPQPTNAFIAVAGIPMNSMAEVKRTVVLGSAQTVYASEQSLYVARQDWSAPSVRDSANPTYTGARTVIEKFALQNGVATHVSRGTVPGALLNQFSLDEFDGNLRVATTKGEVWDERNLSTNNLYVLSKDMKLRGKVEGLAPGERIYSVRFMGKRGYIVTFKKVDPLFALDLSNPDSPSILGKLKIPGYSDYLHPIDETHLIGVGKNAVDAPEQSFAWYQGIKMAIFDVTDPTSPKEMWKTEIGDRGTNSPALQNHKAFLYDAKKQLLALPVTLAELTPEQKAANTDGNAYGDFTFQGAYVYRLTLEKGFELLGRITHHEDNDAFVKSGWYYGNTDADIERVQYIGDTLVTFSPGSVELHAWPSLEKTGAVAYPPLKTPEPLPYEDGPVQIMPTPLVK